jgi:hypothetical protein
MAESRKQRLFIGLSSCTSHPAKVLLPESYSIFHRSSTSSLLRPRRRSWSSPALSHEASHRACFVIDRPRNATISRSPDPSPPNKHPSKLSLHLATPSPPSPPTMSSQKSVLFVLTSCDQLINGKGQTGFYLPEAVSASLPPRLAPARAVPSIGC